MLDACPACQGQINASGLEVIAGLAQCPLCGDIIVAADPEHCTAPAIRLKRPRDLRLGLRWRHDRAFIDIPRGRWQGGTSFGLFGPLFYWWLAWLAAALFIGFVLFIVPAGRRILIRSPGLGALLCLPFLALAIAALWHAASARLAKERIELTDFGIGIEKLSPLLPDKRVWIPYS